MNNSGFTEEQRAEAYRVQSMQQLMQQTKAIESIKTYVAIWFWLSVAAAVLYVIGSMAAANSQF